VDLPSAWNVANLSNNLQSLCLEVQLAGRHREVRFGL